MARNSNDRMPHRSHARSSHPGGGRRAAAASRSRLERRRRQRNSRYGRFLGFAFLGSLVPGVGLVAAGRRRSGVALLVLVGLLACSAGAVLVLVPLNELASYGGDREKLLYIGVGTAALAVLWLLAALVSHRSLEPDGLPAPKRLTGAVVVVLAVSCVIAPMSLASRNAFTQRDLISSIAADDDEESQTTPKDIDKKDPWANKPTLNFLLLGADVGLGREAEEYGVRVDTQIMASIDTATGDTTLISLPRNLSQMPFPEESPLAEYYPYGYIDQTTADPLNGNSMLNSVYNNIPALYPDLEVSASDANKWAVEGALGLDIDYYMMVNLDGFSAIIDALGGITVDVSEPVPIHYGEPDAYCQSRASYIEAGAQHLDGSHALMYARSRCGSSNYKRMERQQCVIRAIIDEAQPQKLLTQYQSLASATKNMVKTDIPADLFPDVIDLTMKIQGAEIENLSINDDFFAEHGGEAANPDYEGLHAAVAEVLEDPVDEPDAESPEDAGDPPSDDGSGTDGEAGEDSSGDDGLAGESDDGPPGGTDVEHGDADGDATGTSDTDDGTDDGTGSSESESEADGDDGDDGSGDDDGDEGSGC
ncbi:LCP family protein [Phytoactinopolyspora halotolerans]|uniref:LytR family transcriptional regulator n=1 Tax=Phytoactinopolyspora halotolerans TaxID=1981512 RepID=A0A6L9SDD8_9ACTN|nr:LCP family protein [Phytoactinopolyspora halotolerans]NEE02511.1 LytR family transcriptional regulator [Phytoactinopolyspora halotolerans]